MSAAASSFSFGGLHLHFHEYNNAVVVQEYICWSYKHLAGSMALVAMLVPLHYTAAVFIHNLQWVKCNLRWHK